MDFSGQNGLSGIVPISNQSGGKKSTHEEKKRGKTSTVTSESIDKTSMLQTSPVSEIKINPDQRAGRSKPPTPSTPDISIGDENLNSSYEQEASEDSFDANELELIPEQAKNAQSPKEYSKTQVYARNNITVNGLPKDIRKRLNDLYIDQALSLPIPEADGEMVKSLKWRNNLTVTKLNEEICRTNDPEEAKCLYTEKDILKIGKSGADGLTKDIRFAKNYRQIVQIIAPVMNATDTLLKGGNIDIKNLTDTLKHSIDIGCDELSKISAGRRENIVMKKLNYSFHKDEPTFHKEPDNFCQTDLADKLFGEDYYKKQRSAIDERKSYKRGLEAYDSPPQKKMKSAVHLVRNTNPRKTFNRGGKSKNSTRGNKTRYDTISPLFSKKLDVNFLPWDPLKIPKIKFLGGRTKYFAQNWEKITENELILNTIKGHSINFNNPPPKMYPVNTYINNVAKIDHVKNLLTNRVIERTDCEGWINQIFFKEKPGGGYRMILNLVQVNHSVQYNHFKLQSFDSATKLVEKNIFFTKIDLKSAYDCMAIHTNSRKYLQFKLNDELFQYRGWPNGLSECPRFFTLIMKPVTGFLGALGILSVIYLDDLLLLCDSPHRLTEHTYLACHLLLGLGFIINTQKSVLEPCQNIEFLGLELNSKNMSIKLPERKMLDIKNLCRVMLSNPRISFHQLASLIGKMHAASRAIIPAPLYYRDLQLQLIEGVNTQGWSGKITLNQESKENLNWWISQVQRWNLATIETRAPDMQLETDASKQGWGANLNGKIAQGPWTKEESCLHINILEMKAILHGLQALVKKQNTTILVKTDNTTAMTHINKMGGTKSKILNSVTTKIWMWCLQRQITITASHIPGKMNLTADSASRKFQDSSDWMLNKTIFNKINQKWGPLTIDLFASRWNTQLPKFFSWKDQPNSAGTNALYQKWPKQGAYGFPPYCIIQKTILKAIEEEADIVLITPMKTNQPWYPKLLEMSIQHPIRIPKKGKLLSDAMGNPHPSDKKLQLAAWYLSSKNTSQQAFHQTLQKQLPIGIEKTQKFPMGMPGRFGIAGALKGKFLPFQDL